MKIRVTRPGFESRVFSRWLTRDRRIKLGKLAHEYAELARAGKPHYFHHFHSEHRHMRFAPEEVGVKVVNSCYQVVDE